MLLVCRRGRGCATMLLVWGREWGCVVSSPRPPALCPLCVGHCRAAHAAQVFEEYDKFDCPTRAWLRLLLDHAAHADSTGSLSR